MLAEREEHGLRYRPDPNTPYSSVSANRSAIDHVQFPSDLLHTNAGDCDDCTVLFCSLLESIGIQTAIIDAPGHVLMMFDSGVAARQHEMLGLDSRHTVLHGGRAWIPIEVTMVQEGFSKAWQLGAETAAYLLRTAQFRAYEISDAWQEFPSVPHESKPAPAAVDAHGGVALDFDELDLKREFHLQREYVAPLQRTPEDHALRSKYARMLVYLGRHDDAHAEYSRLLDSHYELAATNNNLGIALFVAGHRERAMEHFRRAVELDPDDPGFRRNLEFVSQRDPSVAVNAESSQKQGGTRGRALDLLDLLDWSE